MGLNVPKVRIYALGFMGVNLTMAPRAPHGFYLVPHRFSIGDGDPLAVLFDLALRHHAGGLQRLSHRRQPATRAMARRTCTALREPHAAR